ncbi:MAG: AAA family ATPase [Clostridiales bacterium]|nr:AAA family ATPase [Clostridiales bacterium]
MNDIERNKRRIELEVEYNRAVQFAHDQNRDGLAQHLIAAMAQYKLAELATTPESRLAHLTCARTHESLVEERKKVLNAANALEGSDAQPEPAAPAAAEESPAADADKGKKGGRKTKDELYGFDPENCRVKEIPSVSFDDVIGSESTIAALRKAFRHNEELFKFRRLTELAPLASKPDHHLMYGPPGTGKSFLCKAIAHEVMTNFPNTEENPRNSAFFNVNSAEICSPYYAVPEKRLDALFHAAAQYNHCVICIDEMERLCPDRNGSGAEMTAVADAVAIVTRMLQLIDGVTGKCNAIILCATNYPWKVDKAMRDRLSSKLLLDLPNEEAKRRYLERNVGAFLGRTEEQQRQAIDTLLGSLAHASYRDLDTLAQSIQVAGLHKTIANHPGEYELDSFDPLDDRELSEQLAGIVIAYDEAYHARLNDPSRWSNF